MNLIPPLHTPLTFAICTLIFSLGALPSQAFAVGCFFSKGPQCNRPQNSLVKVQRQEAFAKNSSRKSQIELTPIKGVQYQPLSPTRGRWKGSLSGHGRTFLILRLYKGNKLIDQRYVGTVEMKKSEKPVTFSFESPTPRESGILWKVYSATRAA